MKLDREAIGLLLMKLRGDRTQKEVALALNISEPSIRYYETGKRTPNDDLKVNIARYFGKTVTEIFFAFFKRIDNDPNDPNHEDDQE
ncbi:MAG: helix-turn-helix transcriptional regulator [Acetobacterium sp.]|uniref:helix-turn-helix transcriptional regulator n=1 Tax=Acetobacterium sp. TaxID=1872094 RepID=UPI003242481E